jgi:hypothetical protein
LVAAGRGAELFTAVSLSVRRYLGDRFGFDGLESTTREVLEQLRGKPEAVDSLPLISEFLEDADLVKFAKLRPDAEACEKALIDAERVVTRTMPAARHRAEVVSGVHGPGAADAEEKAL